MRKFKGLVSVVVIFSVLFSFSGCSFKLSSLESLIRPPKLTGKYQVLQDTFDQNVGADFDLKTPNNGNYQSAFITYDVDSDGEEEAIVFYSTKDETDIVNFYYFEYENESWKPVCSFEGLGNSVDQVIFSDINKDGNFEMIIGWSLFSSKTNKVFAVYQMSENGVKVFTSYPYTYLDVVDVNGDGHDDVFTMYIDSSIPDHLSGYARAYNFGKNDSEFVLLGETKTDGNISSYYSVTVETVDDLNLIYIEANKGENEMITEIVYWNNEINNLVSPLLDIASQTTIQTWRSGNIVSYDVDSDGFLEIPVSVEMNGSLIATTLSDNSESNAAANSTTNTSSSALYYTKWVKFRDDKLKPVQYSIVNEQMNYMLNIQSSWVGRITVGGRDGQWDFYRWDSSTWERGALLFSIYYYDKSDLQSKELYSSYKEMGNNGNKVFVYTITQEGYDFGVKDETLEKEFILTDLGG